MKNLSFAALPKRVVRVFPAILICFSIFFSIGLVQAEIPIKGEALLVWGTNDPQSPDPHHVPVDAELAKKLSHSPYRWKYYYEVKRETWEIPTGALKKNITMSSHCVLEIKNLGGNRIEIKLIGDGKTVSTNKEPFADNWPLIFAGSAANETAWLVVIRKVKVDAKAESPKVDKVSTN